MLGLLQWSPALRAHWHHLGNFKAYQGLALLEKVLVPWAGMRLRPWELLKLPRDSKVWENRCRILTALNLGHCYTFLFKVKTVFFLNH